VKADESSIRFLRRGVILQGLIEEWKEKGEIRYISFQGEDMETWAHTAPEKVGKKEENGFLPQVFEDKAQTPRAYYYGGQKILEVAKWVGLEAKNRGLLRVGLSTDRIDQIMQNEERNIILFSLLLLIFGGAGVAVISRMENRHLTRVQEMEEKVRQSEKLSSLANLAAGVAHEIRNPLNAIGMAIQRLQREFSPSQPEAQREYHHFTEVLRGEVKRVNQIIEQFLFFARPARMELQPVLIQEVLNDLLMLAKEAAEQQKVRVVENIDSSLPPLRLDRPRIHEALWNLMTNALQAMPRGGRLEVAASHDPENGGVVLLIKDTGEGIPEENISRIFDYYFTTKEKGTGLGLPLAHKIIQGHGGSIEVHSAMGQGTTFQVTLPVSREEG
jgi:signal transduction histidine kinase